MSVTRREFVKQTSLAAAALTASASDIHATPLRGNATAQGDPSIKAMCMFALDAAKTAGASYADVRVSRIRNQSVATREDRITRLVDDETYGVGVRVLVGNTWGFAASRTVTRRECVRVARAAVEQARANQRAARGSVALAPVGAYPDGVWQTPIRTDPFDVPVAEKVDLLLTANQEALAITGARFVNSSMAFVRFETTFASTEGSVIFQTLYRTYPQLTVTAVRPDVSDFQSRTSAEVAPMGMGYEHVEEADLVGRAREWAEEAVRKLSARPVEPGEYDLILDPSHLFLTIHESIGHPTELDRALGYEANYAGTSFIAPPTEMIGKLRYGPEIMNVQGDRTQLGALATVAWDDEGVPADSWPIIEDGVFMDYQTTREQAAWIAELTGTTRSHGCSYASSWDRIQFQRMPNVSLLPGVDEHSIDDLIAATDRGIVVYGRGSYSIDQQRYNFQFGGQTFYEVRGGKVVGMLRDVAYQGRTIDFWNSLDMLGGPNSYRLGGTFFDGKGQPSQANAVSHGCPPARFRGVTVINTDRGE
jgi:TldD protein